MFGFGKKKEPPASPAASGRKGRTNQDLANMGIIIPGVDMDGDIGNFSDDGDSDLEDELALILGGEEPPRPSRSKGHVMPSPNKQMKKPPPKQFDEDNDNEDEDIDENDPNLLNELDSILGTDDKPSLLIPKAPPRQSNSNKDSSSGFQPPSSSSVLEALEQRLSRYMVEVQKAGDQAKARRMMRIVKQYEDAIKLYKSGKPVDYDELPTPPNFPPIPKEGAYVPRQSDMTELPEISNIEISKTPDPVVVPMGLPPPLIPERLHTPAVPPPQVEKPPEPIIVKPAIVPQEVPDQPSMKIFKPETTERDEQLRFVFERQKEYKQAALDAKKRGDGNEAKNFLRIAMRLKSSIQELENGNLIDLSLIPVPPSEATLDVKAFEFKIVPDKEEILIDPPTAEPEKMEMAIDEEPQVSSMPVPTSVMEALEQRLEKYKSEKENAKGNAGKERRMGRIVKQYEDAIKLHKVGKPIPIDELPTPPGFPPIPSPQAPAVAPGPSPAPSTSPNVPKAQNTQISPGTSGAGNVVRGGKQSSGKLTLQERQLATILKRQQDFKTAALHAKQRGDVDQAKNYLKTALGFKKLIEASQSGLPVDLATLPATPESVAMLQSEIDNSGSFEVVTPDDCIAPIEGSHAEVFAKLEEDLLNQMRMCMRTRDHFRNIGEIPSANRFETMALESKRDLDTLRLAARKGNELPKYHYETRVFSITECNTELNENEIEISVLKGINYKVSNPADVDTYIMIYLPFPSAEESQSQRTHVVKDTNNPEYNEVFKMLITRGRNFPRFIHRHSVKFEVWSKGGFLRGSTLIGTGQAKLLNLETKCTSHEAIDILDGRKPVGKLEVKLRVRDPILTKQITQKKEKWLSIDRA